MNLWDFCAPFYNWLRKPWPLSRVLQRETESLRALLSRVKLNGAVVVDIGCGAGHSLQLLDGTATRRIGIDQSPNMARITRNKLKVQVITAAAEQLPLKALSIDLFLAIGVIEYLSDPSLLFQQMAGAGKPGCYVLATSSPQGVFSQLRLLTGIKLYPREAEEILASVSRLSFQVIDQKRFWSQDAFLFRMGA